MNPEFIQRIERHINIRRSKLGDHENTRLSADLTRETGQIENAKTRYEETVRRAEIFSRERFVDLTIKIVGKWVSEGKLLKPEAEQFLDLLNLGYAGEARIETVAATSRLKLVDSGENKTYWLTRASLANRKHTRWDDTLKRINRTLHDTPILWKIAISNDQAVIHQSVGETQETTIFLENSFNQALEIFNNTQDLELKLAAASEGGVARVRQARLLEELKQLGNISGIFKEGRDLVHWSGRRNKNFERSRVIEMWYTQYLFNNKKWLALISTLPTWYWLIRNHEGARKMIKDNLRKILTTRTGIPL